MRPLIFTRRRTAWSKEKEDLSVPVVFIFTFLSVRCMELMRLCIIEWSFTLRVTDYSIWWWHNQTSLSSVFLFFFSILLLHFSFTLCIEFFVSGSPEWIFSVLSWNRQHEIEKHKQCLAVGARMCHGQLFVRRQQMDDKQEETEKRNCWKFNHPTAAGAASQMIVLSW